MGLSFLMSDAISAVDTCRYSCRWKFGKTGYFFLNRI
jgi:hypothetical protein